MSTEPLFSEHWHRVKGLQPTLAPDVSVTRHLYRGVPWYVLRRASTGEHFRVRAAEFEFIDQLDGRQTVESLWHQAVAARDQEAPTQAQLIGLLAQLHEADLLNVDRRLSVDRLFARRVESARASRKQRFLNPLYLRFPLLDPDAWLSRLDWLGRVAFGRGGALAWLVLSVLALMQLVPGWETLRRDLSGFDLLSPEAGITLLLVYPLIKFCHELGHGLAVKRFGGEVHEMGIALLVLLPVPYVDASAATAFARKSERMLVGAAGILVELAIAAVAALVWSLSTPGFVHDLALSVMLISGGSTLLFNGNPLLKFDGYYVLADAVEIPNLAERSRRYLLGKLQRVLFDTAEEAEAAQDDWEVVWLSGYAIASALYRLVLTLSIAWMLSGRFFFFGFALAAWALAVQIGLPVWRLVVYLVRLPGKRRPRAALVTLGLGGALLAFLLWVPLPFNTVVTGIVWLPDNAIVRPAVACEVVAVLAQPGDPVARQDPLFRCADADLLAALAGARGRLDERSAQRAGLDADDRAGRQALERELAVLAEHLARLREQQQALIVRAEAAGRFVPAGDASLAGRRLDQGEVAAFIVPASDRVIRVAVRQADIGDLAHGVDRIEVRLAEHDQAFSSRVVRQTPKAGVDLPSAGLTRRGGGDLPADPADPTGLTSLEPVFDLQLAWPADAPGVQVGGHVHVKFAHDPQPLSRRVVSSVRRAFMERLDV